MEFVASKLGFLKCNIDQHNNINKKPIQKSHKRPPLQLQDIAVQETIIKKRKLSSNQESSSTESVKSDLSFGKLRLSDSGQEQIPQIKIKNKTFISIPTPIRVNSTLMSKSLIASSEFKHLQKQTQISKPTIKKNEINSSHSDSNFIISDSMLSSPLFLQNDYLSFLYTPYGMPSKLIGPLTASQRKLKVQRYLEKKKSRQWKNVRYTVRQSLAQNRKRQQGRFVKSQKKWRWNQMPNAKSDLNHQNDIEVQAQQQMECINQIVF